MKPNKSFAQLFEEGIFQKYIGKEIESFSLVEKEFLAEITNKLNKVAEKISSNAPLHTINFEKLVAGIDILKKHSADISEAAKSVLHRFDELEKESHDLKWEVSFARSINLLKAKTAIMRASINEKQKDLPIHAQKVIDAGKLEIDYAHELIEAYDGSYNQHIDHLTAAIKEHELLEKIYTKEIRSQHAESLDRTCELQAQDLDQFTEQLEALIKPADSKEYNGSSLQAQSSREVAERIRGKLETSIKAIKPVEHFLSPEYKSRLHHAEKVTQHFDELHTKLAHDNQNHAPFTPSNAAASKRKSEPQPNRNSKRNSFKKDE